MFYKEQEKRDIEQVIEIFQDVITTSKDINGNPSMDIVWSEAMGVYYFAFYDCTDVLFNQYRAKAITSAHQLFWIMSRVIMDQARNEWYKDFMKQMDRSMFITKLHVNDLLKERIKPYVDRLPQYSFMADEALKESRFVEVKWGYNNL